MKITAINSTQTNQSRKQNFEGRFIYDELNLLPRQLKQVETVAKNFNIEKKPYNISFYNDPRDSYLTIVAEGIMKKDNKCTETISPSNQRPKTFDESIANLIDKYDKKYIIPNTIRGKIKKFFDIINPFAV